MITSLTADERETTLTVADGGDFVRIDTTRRKDITALRKRANVVEVAAGFHGTTEWAQFLVPAHLYDVSRGVKTPRTLSDEQRAVLAERARLFFGAQRAKIAALDADQGDSGTSGTPEGDSPSDRDTEAWDASPESNLDYEAEGLLEPLDGGEWDDLL
jgi:hypothetical protein